MVHAENPFQIANFFPAWRLLLPLLPAASFDFPKFPTIATDFAANSGFPIKLGFAIKLEE